MKVIIIKSKHVARASLSKHVLKQADEIGLTGKQLESYLEKLKSSKIQHSALGIIDGIAFLLRKTGNITKALKAFDGYLASTDKHTKLGGEIGADGLFVRQLEVYFRGKEISAVKVSAEKFTWMKYKGTNAKILKHEKRNGEVIRTRLEIGDVYGYREVKQRSTGKELVQIVLKSDGMDLAYNISPKTFKSLFLKVSRGTVIPKAFKTKPVIVDSIDKKAKPTEEPVVKTPRKVGSTTKSNINPTDYGLVLKDGRTDSYIDPKDSDWVVTYDAKGIVYLMRMRVASKAFSLIIPKGEDKFYAMYKNKSVPNTRFKCNVDGIRRFINMTFDGSIPSEKLVQYAYDLTQEFKGVPVSTPVPTETPKAVSPKATVPTKLREAKTSLGVDILDKLNGLDVNNDVALALEGIGSHILIEKGEPKQAVYLVVYDPLILQNISIAELESKFMTVGSEGLYNRVIATTLGTVRWELQQQLKIEDTSKIFYPTAENPTVLLKSKSHKGRNYVKILVGHIDPKGIVPKEDTPKGIPTKRKVAGKRAENIVAEVMHKYIASDKYITTVDTNYPSVIKYSVSIGISGVSSVSKVYEEIMTALESEYGSIPTNISQDVEERSPYSQTVVREKSINNETFQQRTRLVKDGGSFKMVFVEFIFDR